MVLAQNFRKIGRKFGRTIQASNDSLHVAAPTRKKRSGVICCKSLRGFYGFIKIGDSEASRLLGVTCMGGLWPRLIQYVFILGGENCTCSDNNGLELLMVINQLKD